MKGTIYALTCDYWILFMCLRVRMYCGFELEFIAPRWIG